MIILRIFLWTAIVLLLFALVYLLVLIRPRGREAENKALLCNYAHRGLHGKGVPENSLEAFELACRGGYGIELDVQLSRDGSVMVFHDFTLTRMTGRSERLSELDKDELTSLCLKGTAQHIPTLEQVLELVNGRAPLLVELKGDGLCDDICQKTAELLKDYRGAYCVESFNPFLVGRMRKIMPKVFCGLLYSNSFKDKKKKQTPLTLAVNAMVFNFYAYPDFIAFDHKDRDRLAVKLVTGLYRPTKFSWTLHGKDELERANALGECGIFEEE